MSIESKTEKLGIDLIFPDDSAYRKIAGERFMQMGFPDIHQEDWRFTNLKPYLSGFDHFNPLPVVSDTFTDEDKALFNTSSPEAYFIVLHNTRLDRTHSELPDGVVIEPYQYSEAEIEGTSEEVRERSLFQANVALHSGGIIIRIKENISLDKPIHVIHHFSVESPHFAFPRHRIIVERNAIAAVIESVHFSKSMGNVFEICHTSISIAENATFQHFSLQNRMTAHKVINQIYATQAEGSTYSNFTFSLSEADLIRNNLDVYSHGPQTHTDMYGLNFTVGDQLVDNHTAMHHLQPDCTSNELYRGVLRDTSKGVFNGKVFVHRLAQRTNAFQKNNNMLLSDKAIVFAKPQLEIFADDVRCSHGCTIGQFDDQAMFYLQSRGIGYDLAKNLLVEAFAFDITSRISIIPLKNYLNKLIHDRMLVSAELDN